MSVPTFEKLFNPLITAMHNLGGSAKNEEIESEVAKILNLSDKDIAEIHRGNRTKLSYRLAWARNYLKRAGLINNSSRGVWYLTSEGLKIQNVNNKDIVNKARNNGITKDVSVCSNQDSDSELVIEQDTWEDKLLSILKRMDPFAFAVTGRFSGHRKRKRRAPGPATTSRVLCSNQLRGKISRLGISRSELR